MSYSVLTPCYNCKQNNLFCDDYKNLLLGVQQLYKDTNRHKGCGTILLSCSNCVNRNYVEVKENETNG